MQPLHAANRFDKSAVASELAVLQQLRVRDDDFGKWRDPMLWTAAPVCRIERHRGPARHLPARNSLLTLMNRIPDSMAMDDRRSLCYREARMLRADDDSCKRGRAKFSYRVI
jgi:hypothetical protein